MDFRTVRTLRGPNVWTLSPVLEVLVDLADQPAAPACTAADVLERLANWLPGLFRHDACTECCNREGYTVQSPGVTWAHVAELAARELLALAGSPVGFSRTTPQREPGQFKIALEYREEEVGRTALALALQLCRAAMAGAAFDVPAETRRLRSLDEQVRLGPSTNAIVQAAAARGIPARRLNGGSLVQFGQGVRQCRILAAETDRTSAIAESIAQDKELTKTLLRAAGVPVPKGRPVDDVEDAWSAAEDIGGPVVVKPQYGNQGRGVAVNLTTREQVLAAYEAALKEGSSIMVEQFAPGADHRLLVVGDKVGAAARREPPQVRGNGRHTIAELVAQVNTDPRRGEDHATPLSKLRLDDIALGVLAEQGLIPDSVLPEGQVAVIRRNANLSTGGTATDVTDQVHPEVAARAVDAARIIGLDVAGVDVVAVDVSRPLEDQGGVVVEVNAGPGLRMHLEPSSGVARPVGEAIISTLFAPGDSGRIPVVAVTGTNGKTTTTRCIAHILRESGRRVGMTCTDGIFVNNQQIDTGDCSGPRSARAVLMHPRVEAAVLETARGGILREGLGFDRCDVAVVTNIAEGDHLGMAGIDTPEQLAEVKRTIVSAVSPQGAAVLNATDPLTAAMAPYCPGAVVFFAQSAEYPNLVAHRQKGGRAVFVRNDAIVFATGDHETRLMPIDAVPLTWHGRIGFQVENVLAAAAAAWSLGISCEAIRSGLETFSGDSRQAPGRFNVLEALGATIIVDYGHNESALHALIAAIARVPHKRRSIMFTAAGDRRDIDIITQSEILANGFDHIVIYEDQCTRGRADGEVIALMRQGLARGTRAAKITETRGELNAVDATLKGLRPGDLVIIQADQVELVVAYVQRQVDELNRTQPLRDETAPLAAVVATQLTTGASRREHATYPGDHNLQPVGIGVQPQPGE